MKHYKLKILYLILLLLILPVACNSAEKEEESLIKKAFHNAQVLNEKSYFGTSEYEDCRFLAIGNEKTKIAIPYILDDEKSAYYYFPFGDNNCITQIMLKSHEYHVFGIYLGQDISSVGGIMKEETAVLTAPIARSLAQRSRP